MVLKIRQLCIAASVQFTAGKKKLFHQKHLEDQGPGQGISPFTNASPSQLCSGELCSRGDLHTDFLKLIHLL